MRDILVQRGLLAREKRCDLPFRLPLEKIRDVEEAPRGSMDLRTVIAFLGTSAAVVKQLAALDLLAPYVAGGGTLTSTGYTSRTCPASPSSSLVRIACTSRS